MPSPLAREEVEKRQTWNDESVFPTPEAFDSEVNRLLEGLAEIKKYQGRLADGPDTLLRAMDIIEEISQRANKVRVYATMSSAVDETNQQAAAMNGKAASAIVQISAASSFVDPELLSIGESKLRQWLTEEPRMSVYEHYFNNLFRKQTHVRTAEVEELLSMLRDPFSGTGSTAGMLANADFKFKPARDSKNKKIEFTQGTYNSILGSTDRRLRRTAWKHYNDK
jgi:oligoendopeptidase F